MCGIAGVFCKKGFLAESYKDSLSLALDSINYRGPDGRGLYIKDNVALGHVRLSIIDLSEAGNQPMISKNGKQIISYNGEVYNFKDLKKELASQEIEYQSATDTEVILEFYKARGVSAFKELNGMSDALDLDKDINTNGPEMVNIFRSW